MKRNLILALIALFGVTLSASAQNNNHTMVIEMNDGTVINIGPNDVKSINFIDGKLTATGEDISAMKQDVGNLKTRTDNLEIKADSLTTIVAAEQKDIELLLTTTDGLKNAFADINNSLTAMHERFNVLENTITLLELKIEAIEAYLDALLKDDK